MNPLFLSPQATFMFLYIAMIEAQARTVIF